MDTLQVALADNTYPIYLGQNLLASTACFHRHIPGQQVLVVSNANIAPLYLPQLIANLSASPLQINQIILSDGESQKNLDVLASIFDVLLEHGHRRNTTIIALGGGVVGDIAGFAAACYQRGVNLIQVPTSLLAQVDASVGGKTAVNHRLGKNMIGAFYQPSCVVIDMDTLKTLPEREFKSGLAEIIKYGLLADVDFFTWLESHIMKLLNRDADSLRYAISKSCLIKAQFVAADEREQNGRRALLNLGHTFAHAIETWANYSEDWHHGEAVAVGLLLAARLSYVLSDLTEQDVVRVAELLQRAGLPTASPKAMTSTDYLRLMARDKKNVDAHFRCITLKKLGQATVREAISAEVLVQLFNFYK